MEKEGNKLIEGSPASYPSTASTEIDSKNIFQSLLDTKFIKGEIRTMDKYPNSDGILELTDVDQFPVGRVDIQLKTLSPKNYDFPRFQCERSFFVYCQNSSLPVILVVVNRRDRKAYWRHIDRDTLSEVSKRMTGESFSLDIPLENCIDGVNSTYVSCWTEKAREIREKLWNYDSLHDQKKLLEFQLKEIDSKLQNPIHLPLDVLRDIHKFLDSYNYILDVEFAAIKEILYPDYWKIGIGILRYQYNDIRFLLYPVEFKKQQTLVKEVKSDDYQDISREMYEGNVLLRANLNSKDAIKETPTPYAYELLESSILSIAGKYNFPLPDEFIAHEYLISFIDHNHAYLDMEEALPSYPLKELKYKLYHVLPMLAASSTGFADWVVEYNHDIDSYHHWKPSPSHKKAIAESIKKINDGFIPKVKVTITSQLYNINLINYYINWLEKQGIKEANRKYKQGQLNEKMYGVDVWKTWNKDVLWANVSVFFDHFYRLYRNYLKAHFPYIQNSLQIIDEDTTIVYVFHFDETHTARPHMEVFHLRPTRPQKGKIMIWLADDSNNPIDSKKFFIENNYDCTIEGNDFVIIRMQVQTLDFMFKISPTYALINEKLSSKLQKFFLQQKKSR